jgi:hypothetical protein
MDGLLSGGMIVFQNRALHWPCATLIAAGLQLGAVAKAEIAQVGRGLGTSSEAPIYYSAPAPDDCGAARLLYRLADLGELPPNVPITSIAFDKRLSGVPVGGSFTVHIKNSAATTLANAPLSEALAGMTKVYTTTALELPQAEAWVTFAFDVPFVYTGNALEVTTVWDAMSGPRTEALNWGYHSTGTVATKLFNYAADPLQPSEVLGTGSPLTRPNTRFAFETPAQGWLVVESGPTLLANGGTYANNTAFANGVGVPQSLRLRNTGGAAIALGAITFTDLIGVTASVTMAPPASLAPGASADILLTHMPSVGTGTVGYTVNLASTAPMPFVYRLQGFSVPTPAPEIDVKVCDGKGRCTPVANNGTVQLGNQPLGVPFDARVQVSNYGTSPLSLTGATPLEHTGSTNASVTITEQLQTMVPSMADVEGKLTIRTMDAGRTSTTLRVMNNDATEPTYTITLASTAVVVREDPTTMAPVAAPDIVVEDEIDVGSAPASQRREVTLIVRNAGNADLIINHVAVRDVGHNYSTELPEPTSLTIAPGAGGEIKFGFKSFDKRITLEFNAYIHSNDPDSPRKNVRFFGAVSPDDDAPSTDPDVVLDDPEDMDDRPTGVRKGGACTVAQARASYGFEASLLSLLVAIALARRVGSLRSSRQAGARITK